MSRRTAAALLVTRGQGRDLEVLLCERSAELRFFGGYWALPGGTVDDADRAAGDDAAAMQACAHRELFEETGLLCGWSARPTASGEVLATLRRSMAARDRSGDDADHRQWAEMRGQGRPVSLRELCRIETPPFAPVLYDTVFFHVPMSHCAGAEPDIWPGELTQGRFVAPGAALTAWRSGELLLVPPVVILLEHLERSADFDAFAGAIAATAAEYRAGRLHQVRFSPGIVLAPLRTPTLPPATTTNCYIVGCERLFVVDPGSPHAAEQQRLAALLDELERPGTERRGAKVEGILLTHHHPDHVGGVNALSTARKLPVHGHALTLDRLAPGFLRGDTLGDGATVPLGRAPDGTPDWHLTAIHTPGHDRGHLCFRESRYDTVLVGDMLSTISTIIVDPPEGHLATYLRSLERLEALPITTLYPAHGPAMRDGQRLVKQYQRHRRQRESGLLQALEKGSGTLEELLPIVYWDADQKLYRFAARSLLAGLQKLAEEGRAQQDGERWSLIRP